MGIIDRLSKIGKKLTLSVSDLAVRLKLEAHSVRRDVNKVDATLASGSLEWTPKVAVSKPGLS